MSQLDFPSALHVGLGLSMLAVLREIESIQQQRKQRMIDFRESVDADGFDSSVPLYDLSAEYGIKVCSVCDQFHAAEKRCPKCKRDMLLESYEVGASREITSIPRPTSGRNLL